MLSETGALEALTDEPALFFEFSALKPTEDAILRFVNIYAPPGEDRAEWVEQVSEMRRAMRLHEAAQSGDPKDFEGLLKVENGTVIMKPHRIGRIGRLGTFWELVPQPPAELSDSEKLIWTAKTFVKQITDSVVFWGGLRPRFDEDPTPDNLSLNREPTSLISALWLQFSRWVRDGGRFLRCKLCDGRFAAGLDGRRIVARFCSDACKFKAYTIRKKRALKLEANGLRTTEIAAQVGSTTVVVDRWIRQARVRENRATIGGRGRSQSRVRYG